VTQSDKLNELQRLVPLACRRPSNKECRPAARKKQNPADREALVTLLQKALKRERRRGAAGHWSYNEARHAALARLYRALTND